MIKIDTLRKQVQVPLPTRYGNFEILAYAEGAEQQMPHMVLANPDTDWDQPVNVRVHSECMTGDVFGSYRCECGEQLEESLRYIGENGGLLIYLRQEGRGIGIINKLHAYIKQDEGLDTADANKVLGFGYDERTYEDAVTILRDLDIHTINLLTNNPDKIEALEKSGIQIAARIPVHIPAREENEAYLKAKKDRFGHLLDEI